MASTSIPQNVETAAAFAERSLWLSGCRPSAHIKDVTEQLEKRESAAELRGRLAMVEPFEQWKRGDMSTEEFESVFRELQHQRDQSKPAP